MRRIQRREQISLSRSCQLFGVSRQAIYQAEQRVKTRNSRMKKIKSLINTVRMKMPKIGTRKLYFLLKDEFKACHIKIGRDALFDYLREENMLVRPKKNYTKTTNSKHWLRKHPNLVKGCEIHRAEQVFVSDITYLKSKERTHYLSLVTDAYSRKIMGYHLSNDMASDQVVKALKMAVTNRKFNDHLIHHSDRGLQYCSAIYQKELEKHQIASSMTEGYDCYQNALAERINGILKNEFFIHPCNNYNELNKMIKESIKIYNEERPHMKLRYKTPSFVHEKAEEKISSAQYNFY